MLGTTCCGKTTIVKNIPYCKDIDDELFPLVSDEEKDFICQTPWTEEIGDTVDRLVKERIKISAGAPLLGTVILDCEVIVYLDIDDETLAKYCAKRGVSLLDALNMKKSIEADLEDFKRRNSKVNYKVLVRS